MRKPLYDIKVLRGRGLVTNGFSLLYNPNEFFKSFPLNVARQKIIDNYIVDFYCSKLNLVIEIDGSIHRLRNEEVETDFDRVCMMLMAEIEKHKVLQSEQNSLDES